MKTNEMSLREMQDTNGGLSIRPASQPGSETIAWIWPEQVDGYVADAPAADRSGQPQSDAGNPAMVAGDHSQL